VYIVHARSTDVAPWAYFLRANHLPLLKLSGACLRL